MPVWKFCIALIREYGFFAELKNLDFSKLGQHIDKVINVPLKDGSTITVGYRDIDKILRTTEPNVVKILEDQKKVYDEVHNKHMNDKSIQ